MGFGKMDGHPFSLGDVIGLGEVVFLGGVEESLGLDELLLFAEVETDE